MATEETQQLILDHLSNLSTGQVELTAKVNVIVTDVALLKQAQTATNARFANCGTHLGRTAACEGTLIAVKQRLKPIEMLAYGGVALVLVAILGAMLTVILRK